MIKTKQKILFLFLVCFSIYCALAIGQGWDEVALLTQGKITLEYLLSLGKIDTDTLRREYYSPIYYSLKFLLMQIFVFIAITNGFFVLMYFSISCL